ncbi:MAG: ABC transporter ATP-binding protein [Acidobacteriota bacterium]
MPTSSEPRAADAPWAIRVEDVGKRYRLGRRDARAETVTGALMAAVRQPLENFRRLRALTRFDDDADGPDVLWALRDVSFTVAPGEVVGILGRNGAGKSTLLKILARITPPTRGRFAVRGSIASLLEVGTGFHPELTGRENIFLNGAILGMRRAEIADKLDEIVDFSGVETFLDTPIKRYSSGMRIRLAFAVAAHLEPDVLLIDEVLAVGDVMFQQKCLGKMESIAKGGRTVLFVSHNVGAVAQLCTRGVVLENHRVVFDGPTDAALSRYLQGGAESSTRVVRPRDPDAPKQIVEIALEASADAPSIDPPDDAAALPPGAFDRADGFDVVIGYDVGHWTPGTYLCLEVTTLDGVRVLWSCDVADAEALMHTRPPGSYRVRVRVPGGVLAAGRYRLTAALYQPGRDRLFDAAEDVLGVEILDRTSLVARLGIAPPAVTSLPLTWMPE